MLVDPFVPNGELATNFNPFITDINTVRGQETGYCTFNPLVNIHQYLIRTQHYVMVNFQTAGLVHTSGK